MNLNDRLGQKVQSGRAFFVTSRGRGMGCPALTSKKPRAADTIRERSNAVVAADNLGSEKAELGRELTVEVSLTEPALRLDEA
jgi:hypothetical protein